MRKIDAGSGNFVGKCEGWASTVSALTITTTSDTTRYVYSGADPAMLAELRGVVGPLLPRGGNWRRILCEGRAYQALEGLEVGFEGLAAGG
jgi:hypothetical protein